MPSGSLPASRSTETGRALKPTDCQLDCCRALRWWSPASSWAADDGAVLPAASWGDGLPPLCPEREARAAEREARATAATAAVALPSVVFRGVGYAATLAAAGDLAAAVSDAMRGGVDTPSLKHCVSDLLDHIHSRPHSTLRFDWHVSKISGRGGAGAGKQVSTTCSLFGKFRPGGSLEILAVGRHDRKGTGSYVLDLVLDGSTKHFRL